MKTRLSKKNTSIDISRLWGFYSELIDEIKHYLSEKQLLSLTAANEYWLKYVDSIMDLEGLEAEGGTIMPVLEYSAATRLTKERIKYLRNLLKHLRAPENDMEVLKHLVL